jgi:ABC-type multidrug transport system fused ATPase/permease subunit
MLNAILDFFSIAFFIPLISLIVNPSFVSSNEIASHIYYFLGFQKERDFILFFTVCLFAFILLKNLISLWIARYKVRYAFKVGQYFCDKAVFNYLQKSFLDFSRVDFTRELNRITNYPFAFSNNILIPFTTFISEAIICILFLAGIAFYDFKVLLLSAIFMIPAMILYFFRKRNLERISHGLKEKYPAFVKSSLQVVEGFPEIKIYGKESFFRQKVKVLGVELAGAFMKDQTMQAGTIRFTEIIVGTITCALITYTVYLHTNYQQIILLFSVYVAAGFRLIPSASRILHALQQIRVSQYLFDELTINDNMDSEEGATLGAVATFEHSISFNNISFSYPEGPVVLQNVSFSINKGEKIGIVGNSGEGKTSILLLLLRFLQETSGEVIVDGRPLTAVSEWRKLIGYVPQNPYMLDGSICENIAMGIPERDIDRDKIRRIVDALGLKELVNNLPKGIDSRIGERGATLSGGQKQRLAIGRALYIDASILLLDEITNQVHASVESEILGLLDQLAREGKTIVMVTHKVPRRDFFNLVYRIEKGSLHKETRQSETVS